jgi:hypothetical protein
MATLSIGRDANSFCYIALKACCINVKPYALLGFSDSIEDGGCVIEFVFAVTIKWLHFEALFKKRLNQ